MPLPEPELVKFAERIKALRGTLTQAQAATRAGIGERTWQNYERCLSPGKQDQIRAVADAFGGGDADALYDELWMLGHGPGVEIGDRFTDAELDRLAVRLAPFLSEQMVPRLVEELQAALKQAK